MGGVYSYMFDITVFLFTTAFNLTGLPYSAGYVGKEFLMFHMMRDDILAFIARSAILVSLLFTPIYMHILVFVVMFGPKRGFIGAYSTHWKGTTLRQNSIEYGYTGQLRSAAWVQVSAGYRSRIQRRGCQRLVLNTKTCEPLFPDHLTTWFNSGLATRTAVVTARPFPELFLVPSIDLRWYQQTTMATGRLMGYLLFFYHVGFAYFGEILLLTSVGTSTSPDLIHSPNFFAVKSHIFTMLSLYSSHTLTQFALMVQGLSVFALIWLLVFNSHNSYAHLRWQLIGLWPLLCVFLPVSLAFYL